MRNLLLLLVLANVLYFLWGRFVEEPEKTGVVVVRESQLGPALSLASAGTTDPALLGAGNSSDLAAVVGRSCVSVGPFKSSDDANDAAAGFEGQGMRTSIRSTQGQVFVGHWVQIRDVPNRAAGNAMLEKLREGGLGDAYLVSTEDEGLKISLGLFGELQGAERIELQAKSLELPADISPRMSDAMVYFVDVGLPPGRGAGSMIEQYGEERVLLRDKATCPTSN